MNESELLFSYTLGCDRAGLYRRRNNLLSKEDALFVSSVLKRRLSGEPLQYILGKADFFGLEFSVNRSVLIPRPETELLVEEVIKIGEQYVAQSQELKILDVGTGSGCIAVSLAKAIAAAQVTAVDISRAALEVAGENARHHAVALRLLQSDIVAALEKGSLFDIIVSNPPYVKSGEIKGLQPEVQYEPAQALDGGRDGLDFYRRLAKECPLHLRKNGFIVLEIGYDQRPGIEDIFQRSTGYEVLCFRKDYSGRDRIAVIKRVH
jgi:release factor glutamine methyltransferase